MNAWKHAEGNAEKMRVVSPIDGMVVLKSTWKSGTMGEVQEGEEVRAGLSVMDVIDPSAMRVRVKINQADVRPSRRAIGADHARLVSDSARSPAASSSCRRSARSARCRTAFEAFWRSSASTGATRI
jgi:hypothetical protein